MTHDRKAEMLADAVQLAANVFRQYERLHMDKGSIDGDAKARTNCQYAEQMEAALSAWNTRDEEGRCELPADHPLVKALHPSAETIARIEEMGRANATACHALRDTLIGSNTRDEGVGVVSGLEPVAGHEDGCGAHDSYPCDCKTMTEQEIDERWPVLAQVVRAIEWHGNPDPGYFGKSFEIEREFCADQLDAAEAELAALPGATIVEVIRTEPGETHDAAPAACIVLTRYFN